MQMHNFCWAILVEKKNSRQRRSVGVRLEERGRRACDKYAVTLGEGDNLGVEGKTAGLLP